MDKLVTENLTENNEKRFYFRPVLTTVLFFIVLMVMLVFVYILFIEENKESGYLIMFSGFIVLTMHPFLIIAKSFFKLITGQLALVLTESEIFDNWNDIKLKWADVKNIQSEKHKWSFICLNPNSAKIVYLQVKNPVRLAFMVLENLISGGLLKINLSVMKGENSYIISEIKSSWRKATQN